MEILNWLHDVHVAGTNRVWVTGWAAHCHDVVEGVDTRLAWEPIIEWLNESFVGRPVGGHDAAVFSTIAEARNAFIDWEAEHPGATSFDYSYDETNWNAYPYLPAAAHYLVTAEHVVDLPPVGSLRMHRLLSSEEPDAFDLYVAYTVSGSGIVIDLSKQLGSGEIAVVDTRSGTWEVVPTDSVPIVPHGAILVAPEDAIAISMFGDLDGNGRINGADLAILLGSWGTDGKGDLDDDGDVDGSDLAKMLGNWLP